MINTIFVIQGYEQKMEDGRLLDVVVFEVYAKNEKEAVNKAKKYLKKPFYRVSNIIEKNEK
jgi:hypothetical protein